MIEYISSPGSPKPRGPYSPAVRAGDFIFVAGQGGGGSDVKGEKGQGLKKNGKNLEACGADLARVVLCGGFLIICVGFLPVKHG